MSDARVKELLHIIEVADQRLNRDGDPIAAHLWLRKALDAPNVQPDHRVCRCGHVGSVHDPATDGLRTALGYAIKGAGRCFGRTDGGLECSCNAARYARLSDRAILANMGAWPSQEETK